MLRLHCISILSAVLVFTIPAQAASVCGKRDDFIKALTDKFQEQSKAMGIAGQKNLLEVFTSNKGTWTVLMTTPSGTSCIIAAGNSWEDTPPTKNLTSL